MQTQWRGVHKKGSTRSWISSFNLLSPHQAPPAVEVAVGSKRLNPESALALVQPKTSVYTVEKHKQSLSSAGSSQAPLCGPWDRGDLMRRLATFKSMTWFAKPKAVSAVNCARRGWVNVETDIIACESCGACHLFSAPSSWTQQQVEKVALVFSLKLDNEHKFLCPGLTISAMKHWCYFLLYCLQF